MHEEIKQTLIEFLAIIGLSFLLALALIAMVKGINLIVRSKDKDNE